MEDRNMPKADFLASIALIAFGVWIIVRAIHMPRFETLGANPFSVPGIVPGILGAIITLLSLMVFVRSLRNRGYRLGLTVAVVKKNLREPSFKRMGVTCLICVAYGSGLVGFINYYAATFLYVFAFLIVFQIDFSETLFMQRKIIIGSFIQAVLISGAVGAVFRYLFLVDLP